MKKYIQPELNVCKFSAEDIITTSAVTPSTAEGYSSAVNEVAITENAYVINWPKE